MSTYSKKLQRSLSEQRASKKGKKFGSFGINSATGVRTFPDDSGVMQTENGTYIVERDVGGRFCITAAGDNKLRKPFHSAEGKGKFAYAKVVRAAKKMPATAKAEIRKNSGQLTEFGSKSVGKISIKKPEIRLAKSPDSFAKPVRIGFITTGTDASVGERLDALGAMPGRALHGQAQLDLASRVIAQSRDIFPDADAAKSFFDSGNFDNTGKSAVELLAEGRTARVLTRLDELRYGPQG